MSQITALEIEQWADSLAARAELPRLLRRLVLATVPDVQHIDMPAGEGIQRHGLDGIVHCMDGNAWVRAGDSAWEFGTDKKPKAKADSDYATRLDTVLVDARAEMSFIFVTPRKWDGKKGWAEERRRDGQWAEVHAYDAHDIEACLEHAPHVEAWLAEIMGKRLPGVRALSQWWVEFSHATAPVLPIECS